jgi:hypothetical protein
MQYHTSPFYLYSTYSISSNRLVKSDIAFIEITNDLEIKEYENSGFRIKSGITFVNSKNPFRGFISIESNLIRLHLISPQEK